MCKLIPLLIIFSAPSARADLTHSLSSSISLDVHGAATISERIGSSYSVSGNNIKVDSSGSGHFGTMTAATATAAAGQDLGTYDINTPGSAFSFSESWTQGDVVNPIGTGVDVTSGIVADMPAFGVTTTQSGGVAGSLAGTILSSGVMTLTAGGAGTTGTSQFVSTISVD